MAKGVEGQACLNLGQLNKAMGKDDQTRHCFTRAIQIFEECEAAVYLDQAKDDMMSLSKRRPT
jgi:hypothetical protein